jgi:hypothetical protein
MGSNREYVYWQRYAVNIKSSSCGNVGTIH